MLDLGKKNVGRESEAGYMFELVYPSTGEISGRIKVRGALSPVAEEAANRLLSEERIKEKRRGKDYIPKPEDNRRFAVELALSRILAIEDIAVDGVPLVFNPNDSSSVTTVREILTENMWITEAVLQESNEITNFRPK